MYKTQVTMKKLRTLIITLLSVLILVGCGQTNKYYSSSSNYDTETAYFGASVESMQAYVYYYTLRQVDSMCVADNLPRNLDEWITERYLDAGMGYYVIKRMYIKEYSEVSELIYIIIPREELYKVTKRFVNYDPNEEANKNRKVKKNPPKGKLIKYDKFNKDVDLKK